MLRAWLPVLLLLSAMAGHANAAEGCLFEESPDRTWTLVADCTVDGPIVLPDGVTLDGAQHTIIAVDPVTGPFRGAIIVNGGGSANVVNTIITALDLTNVCQEGNARLRAIYFNGGSGTIRGNTIVNVNKGASACQEGNAIEVRNVDLSGRPTTVQIVENQIEGFQKTGIVVSGHVDVAIRANSIGASAAQRLMVTNGIQVGAGAYATIEGNAISGNSWAGNDAAATAILLMHSAAGTVVRNNMIVGNADVGIYVMADGVRVERNRLTDTGSDGAFDVGIGNYGDGNVFDGNSIKGFYYRYQNVDEPDPAPGNTTVAAR